MGASGQKRDLPEDTQQFEAGLVSWVTGTVGSPLTRTQAPGTCKPPAKNIEEMIPCVSGMGAG